MSGQADLAQGSADSPESPQGALLAQVSNTVVGLYKRLYGRGPTKARSYFLDGVVVTILRGGMTRAEATLVKSGRAETVARQRHEFHEAVRDEFAGAVADVLGRPVVAYMSAMHHDPDVTVDVFVLEGDAGAG